MIEMSLLSGWHEAGGVRPDGPAVDLRFDHRPHGGPPSEGDISCSTLSGNPDIQNPLLLVHP